MNFFIVFDRTGDTIPFETINKDMADLLTYYVENLDEMQANTFFSQSSEYIQQCVYRLDNTIKECNKFVGELLDHKIESFANEEYLDQRNLNKLHADWVHSQKIHYNIQHKREKYQSSQAERIHDMFPDDIPEPPLGTVIQKLGFRHVYDDINLAVHDLENSFKHVRFSAGQWVEIPNPYPTSWLTNSVSNFMISFNHLGRPLYNKFVTFDHDMEFDDENTYKELLGFVEMRFEPPETIALSPEYVTWCNGKGKTPSGQYLNVGNIPDLRQNLTQYRKIIFRNTLQKQSFSIKLHKGT